MNPLKPSMMISFLLNNVKETHSARIFTLYQTNGNLKTRGFPDQSVIDESLSLWTAGNINRYPSLVSQQFVVKIKWNSIFGLGSRSNMITTSAWNFTTKGHVFNLDNTQVSTYCNSSSNFQWYLFLCISTESRTFSKLLSSFLEPFRKKKKRKDNNRSSLG